MATPDCITKTCTKCGKEYSATTEYWYREKRGKYGLRAQCKPCVAVQDAQPERVAKRREYATSEHGKRVKQECDAAYRAANREAIAEKKRLYSVKHSAEIVARVTEWRRNNPEKLSEHRRRYHAKHRDKVNAKGRRWRQRFPEKERAKAQRRRAREANAPGQHSARDIRVQFKSQHGKCWWCDKPLGDSYHVDHRVPLNRGGSNAASNLCIACADCNLAKGAKMPHEWNGRLL